MTTRKAYTPNELRELAAEPLDVFHPHVVDCMRGALAFCADVIDAANQAVAPLNAEAAAKDAEIKRLKGLLMDTQLRASADRFLAKEARKNQG